MSFGENLTRLLKERGVRKADVASAVGITRTAVTYFANGKTIPSLYTAKRIADFFGVPLDEMMRQDSRMPKVKGGKEKWAE